MHEQRASGWTRRRGAKRRQQAIRLSIAARRKSSIKLIAVGIPVVLVLLTSAWAMLRPSLVLLPSTSTGADHVSTSLPVSPAVEGLPLVLPTIAPTAIAPTVAAIPSPTATLAPVKGLIALTFDAGADRGYAEDMLDLLATVHAPSTFGVTGEWARHNPDLVQRMAAEGHQVINHTMDHRSFTGLSDELGGLAVARRRAELEQADALIAPLIGHTTRPWYRLPYGDDDPGVAEDVAPTGFTRKVGWTVDSGGWRGWSADQILSHCLQAAEPGAIYVMHVGQDSQDRLALGELIAGLRERGYGFATVAELIP